MIKILKSIYECNSCGNIIISNRELVVDKYLKEIVIVESKCKCGRKAYVINIALEDYVPTIKQEQTN